MANVRYLSFPLRRWEQNFRCDAGMHCWRCLTERPEATGILPERREAQKGFRAVGMANNRNPIAMIIPCHRIIGSDGKLVGYGGGLDIKVFLLELERKNAHS